MELLGLQYAGIGPYKGTVSIDFTALSAQHMFLIEGETGSGKSTLLDAVVFALYSDTAGDGTDKSRLRSKFLEHTREASYVDLIFAMYGRVYRIYREPQYDMPKQRGEGTTSHSSKATLAQVDHDIRTIIDDIDEKYSARRLFEYTDTHSHVLSTRNDEIGAHIRQIIGLTREQFMSTVMLAQGDFSRFLTLNPEDRTELLTTLVDAGIFTDIQDRLEQLGKEHEQQVKATQSQVRLAVAQAHSAARDIAQLGERISNQMEERTEAPSIPSDLADWCLNEQQELLVPALTCQDIQTQVLQHCSSITTQCDEWAQALHKQSISSQAQLQQAQKQATLADQFVQTMHAFDQHHTTLKQLQADTAHIQEVQQQLDQDTQAQRVAPILRHAEETEQAVKHSTQALTELETKLSEASTLQEIEQRLTEAQQAATKLPHVQSELTTVKEHLATLKELNSARDELSKIQEEAATARIQAREAAQASTDYGTSAAIQDQLTKQRAEVDAHSSAPSNLTRAKEALDAAKEADQLTERITAVEQELPTLRQQLNDTQQSIRTAQAIREADAAASLLHLLHDGEACPLCGSLDHPHPYTRPDAIPSDEYIERLQHSEHTQQAAIQAAEIKIQTLRNELKHAQQTAQGSIDQCQAALAEAESLAEQYRHAQEQERELQAQLQKAIKLEQHASTLQAKAQQVIEQEKLCAQKVTYLEERVTGDDEQTLTDRYSALQEEVTQLTQQADTVAKVEQQRQQRRELEQQHIVAQSALKQQQDSLQQAQAQLTERLAALHCENVETLRAMLLTEPARHQLEQEVERHHNALVTCIAACHTDAQSLALNVEQAEQYGMFAMQSDALERTNEVDYAQQLLKLTQHIQQIESEQDLIQHINEILHYQHAIDPDRVYEQVQIAQDKRDAIREVVTELHSLQQRFAQITHTLTEVLAQWGTQLKEIEPLLRMADLTNARRDSVGRERMSLTTYAVLSRFNDILQHANEILNHIHGGLYQLQIDERSGRANMKTGLRMCVFDRGSNEVRTISSLSGGETFYVSLALALALTDTVSAYRGGITLNTLFIDEGFGSLSDDYLDGVMEVLRDMSQHRTIGLISHVGALKDQIPARISVRRISERGESTARVEIGS